MGRLSSKETEKTGEELGFPMWMWHPKVHPSLLSHSEETSQFIVSPQYTELFMALPSLEKSIQVPTECQPR